MSFACFNLDARLMAGIARAGYTTPTPVQVEAMPVALAGHDLIGTAQTGTGKTAAFVLPLLQRLIDGPRGRIRALIVTPTRELAEQIFTNVRELGAATGLRCATIYGGVGAAPQIRALRDGVEIVVACPGRLLDHIEHRHAKLGAVEVLVLDEADRMFDMGFLPAVKKILQHVPAQRQTMLFSATFPKEIEQLAAQTQRHPKRVTLGLARPAQTVQHSLYPVPQHLKTALLLEFLKQPQAGSVLVFARTRRRAQRITQQIERTSCTVASLHSDRSQSQRQAALNGFRQGRYRVLVATDIASRGLDVEGISHVVNYDMPDTADAYIHRIGRTGRAERTGDALTFVTPEDRDMVRTLERILGQPLSRGTMTNFDYNAPAPRLADGGDRPARTARPDGRASGGRASGASPRASSSSRTASPRTASSAPAASRPRAGLPPARRRFGKMNRKPAR
jgi:ATP-dependent RNA helicase RhlE